MNILVLGGTQFIGRHMVDALLEGGHEVSVFTRGRTRDELPTDVERIRGDRNAGVAGLDALKGRDWDVCIDVSGYLPRQVRPSAEQLQPHLGRYVFVSTAAVYAETRDVPILETHQRLAPASEDVAQLTWDLYGALKVTCEDIIGHIYGDRATFLRPQIVAGPHDPTGRYTYWVHRAARGGAVLAPGDGSDHVQVVDVRDVARFTRMVVEDQLSGPFNLAGRRLTWAQFMQVLGVERPVWVDTATLGDAGVTLAELPLFMADAIPRSCLMHVSYERTRAAGLHLTDPVVTALDVRDWIQGRDFTPPLSPERERELIARSRGTLEADLA